MSNEPAGNCDIDKDNQRGVSEVREPDRKRKTQNDNLEKRKNKDIWDVLSSLSGLFTFLSSIVIAWLGVQFTEAYKRKEVSLVEAQTIEKFLPHLSGTNEDAKRGAILALATLNNKELASRLGSLYASKGTIEALEVILKNTEGDSQILLKDALIEAYDSRGADLYDNDGDLGLVVRSYSRIFELQTPEYISTKWGPEFLRLLHIRRGNALRNSEKYDEAIKDYKTALELFSDDNLAHYNLGKLYADKSEFDLAMVHLNRAIQLNPRRASFYCGRGWAKERMKAFDEALSDYNNAVDLDPQEYCGFYNRALFYLNKGDSVQAAKDFQKALENTDNKQDRTEVQRELQRLQGGFQPKTPQAGAR